MKKEVYARMIENTLKDNERYNMRPETAKAMASGITIPAARDPEITTEDLKELNRMIWGD